MRPRADYADVKALMNGCLARVSASDDSSELDRIVAVSIEGLRTR